MIEYVNSKNRKYKVLESYIEVDYVLEEDYLKYCVQGLVPCPEHFPEVTTLELCDDVQDAIRIHHDIMMRLGALR